MTDSGRPQQDKRDSTKVFFITRARPAVGEVELHSVGDDLLARSLEHVKDDWRIVSGQVLEMVSATNETTTKAGYKLDEVSIGLGFNAKGKLAFIAEAGIQASVTVKFKRSE